MNEKWIEEIKRNDEMTMLDRYFPGKSCGNTECEQHCIELCKIAERIGGMKKDEIVSAVARVLVYPENCPALKSGQNHESCRFPLFSHDRISAYDDRTGRRIIGKKYISDADASKSGACKKCLEYANRIFKWPEEADKMPKLPLHPNCKCHYEDVYENELQTRYLDSLKKELIKKVLFTQHEIDKIIKMIMHAKQKLIASKKISDDSVFLLFNGRYLISSDGKLILDAVSGKPVDEYSIKIENHPTEDHVSVATVSKKFDYSIERQKLKGIGGIPEGIYYIDIKEKRFPQKSPISHVVRNNAWGVCSWVLHKETETETYGRSGFFIHGGNAFGSAGCIDVKEGDSQLEYFLNHLHGKGKFYIYVHYRQKEELIIDKVKTIKIKDSFQRWSYPFSDLMGNLFFELQ